MSLVRRANDLGESVRMNVAPESSKYEKDEVEDELYIVDTSLESNTHMTFPCDLENGEKINIDLKSDGKVDVHILDNDDYQAWDSGKDYEIYKEFLERSDLHAFFKARATLQYLVVVNN